MNFGRIQSKGKEKTIAEIICGKLNIYFFSVDLRIFRILSPNLNQAIYFCAFLLKYMYLVYIYVFV